MDKLRYIKNVATVEINASACSGCGVCTEVCPHGVIEVRQRKATLVDKDACMECGACMRNCPAQAVKVNTGVGCAAAIIIGAIKGTAPDCGCSCESKQSCC